MGRRILVRIILASLALSGIASAAPSRTVAPPDHVVELVEQAARAYREGRFQEVVDKLREAQKTKPQPVILYSLGRAYEALGDVETAADMYSQYLHDEPGASDRRAIEARVTTLRAQAAELAAARKATADKPAVEPTRDTTTPSAKPDRAQGVGVAPWIVTGVGVLGIGAGVLVGLAAHGKHDDAVADPSQSVAVSDQNGAEHLATAATVTIVAGAVVAAVGVVWVVYRMIAQTSTPPARTALGWSF